MKKKYYFIKDEFYPSYYLREDPKEITSSCDFAEFTDDEIEEYKATVDKYAELMHKISMQILDRKAN